jgi:hypothetical protein
MSAKPEHNIEERWPETLRAASLSGADEASHYGGAQISRETANRGRIPGRDL